MVHMVYLCVGYAAIIEWWTMKVQFAIVLDE